jgi:hypothetical protein
VPCPDVVIKRVFEIASATSSDRHVDLGCGDGRLNFAAVSFPHFVESSLGVDVDENVLERAKGRRDKRFVPSWNNDLDDEKTVRGEMDRLEFVQGDLVEAIRRQKEMHQKKLQLQSNDNDASIEDTTDSHRDLCTEIDKLNDKISTCTVITMYFVQCIGSTQALSRIDLWGERKCTNYYHRI